MLWHHWSAYIAPAEMMLTCAAIFHDFSAQYGLGPTALIASSCANDCWLGMYYISGFTTVAFSLLITALALGLSRKYLPERLAVLALCLATCFFWTAIPPSTHSPIVTPSVSGLRFLPMALMVTYLFFSNKIECSKPKILIAHCLWVLGALWSPESAFYLTCVWWPYYIFIRRGQGSVSSRLKATLNAAMQLFLIAAGLAIVFNIFYHVIYHKGPTLYGFLAYVINPPGPLPIDPHGGVWYFFLTMVIGVMTLVHLWRKSGDTPLFRHGFLLILMSYTAFTYFLGRSHDNNLLNLMPFFLLVLLHAISAAGSKGLTRASVCLVAALIGWLPVFGWDSWNDNVRHKRVLLFKPEMIREARSYSNPVTQANIIDRFANNGVNRGFSADAARGLDFIRKHYEEPVTVLDFSQLLSGTTSSGVWSAMHGVVNYTYIPSRQRQKLLSSTAASLNRPGWLIIDRKFAAEEWLTDFDSVYDRTNRIEFGAYYAIRFSPKTNS